MVYLLLNEDTDVNGMGGQYGIDETIVQMLLNMDVDVNATGGEFSNALHVASVGGF
jgi:hypothetical protein